MANVDHQLFGKGKKQVEQKIIQTVNSKVEELFNSFAKQYKEEQMLYKQNSRRLNDKIQELEINIHEHKGALEYSKDIIKKKEDEMKQKLIEQTTLKKENEHLLRRLHELEKKFTANEIIYAKKIDVMNTERIEINAEKAAAEIKHMKVLDELTANLSDLQEKLNGQIQETDSLKEQLNSTSATSAKKMEELRNTFIEEKTVNNANFAKIIEELEVELQLKQKEINKCLLESGNINAAKNVLLQEQMNRVYELDNYVASDAQKIEEILSFNKPIVKTTPIITTSIAGNLGKHDSLGQEKQHNEGHHKNFKCSIIPYSKQRAHKRMASYIRDDSLNSSDENEVCTEVNPRRVKKQNLDVSYVTTSDSPLCFIEKHQDNVSDHIVRETSESDEFDRLKLLR